MKRLWPATDKGEIVGRHGEESRHLTAGCALAIVAVAVGDECRFSIKLVTHGATGALAGILFRHFESFQPGGKPPPDRTLRGKAVRTKTVLIRQWNIAAAPAQRHAGPAHAVRGPTLARGSPRPVCRTPPRRRFRRPHQPPGCPPVAFPQAIDCRAHPVFAVL